MSEESKRPTAVLQHCLVEDEGATLRSPRRRRLSLLLSATLQVAILGGVLLIPLLVNGEKLEATVLLAPGIPYPRGVTTVQPPKHQATTQSNTQRRPPIGEITVPTVIPPRPAIINEANESGGSGEGSVAPFGIPNGVPGLSPETFNRIAPPPPLPPNPPAPKQPVRIRVTQVEPGMLLHRIEPAYPAIPKQIRLEGVIRLRAIIGRDGLIRDLEVLSGHPMFIPETLKAVSQWRYRPTLLNGGPVEVETQITVVFKLRQ